MTEPGGIQDGAGPLAPAGAALPDGLDVVKLVWILTVLAFFVERALSLIFEHRLFRALETEFHVRGVKELVAFGFAWLICSHVELDAFAMLFDIEPHWFTVAATAAVVAGGSKGAIRLMRDVWGVGRPEGPPAAGRRAPKP